MGAPEVMEGGGHYNAHSSAQAIAGRRGEALLAEAARAMPVPAGGTAVVADYGASQGRNSLAPMNTAIAAAREAHGADLPILVVHTDLPGNDFATLFTTVATDPATYARPGVFTTAVGRSFYEQILPGASVSAGWSSIAVHWLSATPGPLSGIWYTDATPAEHGAWSRHAAADWRAFLDARSAELLPGARLVVVVGAADAAGASGAEHAFALIDAAMRAMVGEGTLDPDEHAVASVPAWYRTEAEWRAPFPRPDLALERLDVLPLRDPFWGSVAAAEYPTALATSLRVSFGPSLLAHLPPRRRSAVAGELFDVRLRDAIAADPEAASPRWLLAVMVIARTGRVTP